MEAEEFEKARTYWERKDAKRPARQVMPADELRQAFERFVSERDTCALATGAGDRVRCTPLEYSWRDGAFWIFSEGGQKFYGLARNPQVSLAVFDPYSGFGKIRSAQVSGTAEVVDPASDEFAAAVAEKGVPAGGVAKLAARVIKFANMLHLIKVVPEQVDYLDSALKKRGYATRQHLDW